MYDTFYTTDTIYTSLDGADPRPIPTYDATATTPAPSDDDRALAVISDAYDLLYSRQTAWERVQRARDRYEVAAARASGVSGIRYDKDRVQTSPSSGDDALVDMVEAHDAYEAAYQQYCYRCQILAVMIDICPCTLKQKMVLSLRYNCDSAPPYSQIGAAMGLTTHAAEVLETRAFTSMCKHLMRLKEAA